MEIENPNVNEIIEDYIAAVLRLLPKPKRAEVRTQLSELITDRVYELSSPRRVGPQDMYKILSELGTPAEYASKHRRMLIFGPDYFAGYLLALRLIALLGAVAAAEFFFLDWATEGAANILSNSSVVMSLMLQAVGFVTLLFAIAHNSGFGKSPFLADRQPVKYAPLKTWEPALGMTMSVIFLIVFNFYPQVIGFFEVAEEIRFNPVFNLCALNARLNLINLIFGLEIFREAIKLCIGRFSPRLSLTMLALNLVSIVLVYFILKDSILWDKASLASLFPQINKDIDYYVNVLKRVMFGVFVLIVLIDTGYIFYKGCIKVTAKGRGDGGNLER